MQAVKPGKMTLALPLKPSVPPSMMGMTEDWIKSPSSCPEKTIFAFNFLTDFFYISYLDVFPKHTYWT